MKHLINAFVVLMIFNASFALNAQERQSEADSSTLRRQLEELNRSFTYQGKPIHPRAIQDLVAWVSDALPGPVAVDVEGAYRNNRYFGDYELKKDGLVFIDLSQNPLDQEGSFAYERLGKLANGLHVLRTFANSGGTGVFQSLLLVECLIDFEYKNDGSRRSLLVIKRRGEFALGDRYSGTIKLEPAENAILIGSDKGNVKKPYRVKLR